MIRINDSGKFESIIGNIEQSANKIAEIFERANTNMEKINGTDTWSGPTQEECYNKYKELSGNYGNINKSLTTYVNFLRQTISDYIKTEHALGSDINTNANNFDVNS